VKAALYVRVSTDEQVEGYSLTAQTNLLTAYCKKENIEVYKIYADEGISGQKENRPQFQQMITDAESKQFHIILVHKYDRFARKVELSQRIKGQLSKCNINVVSITEPIEDNPMGFFVSGLHELMAEYYIKNLAQEVKKGMRERVKQGLSNGSVPYGYTTEKGHMCINQEQAAVVKKIFNMYNEGYGTPRISNWLAENGISSPVPGCVWNHYTILYILKNIKYIGYIKHAGEIYKGLHEPIIENSTFELAQKYLVDRMCKREPKGKNELKFMLLGLARCGVCGKKMGIHASWKNVRKQRNGESYYYYVCSGHKMHENTLRCSNSKYHPADQLENQVLKGIEYIIEGQEAIVQSDRSIDYIAKNQVDRIEKEKARAKAAYLSEDFTIEEYRKVKDECEAKLKAINSEIKKNSQETIKRELKNVMEEVRAETSPAKKRLLLSKYVKAVRIYPDDRVSIHF